MEVIKKIEKVKKEIGKVIVGQDEVVNFSLIALLSGGHILLEGVPGLGKTMLVKTLANVLNISFNRIQFTPDLMPSDITGTNIIIPGKGEDFQFKKGPIFANLVLADEINRATPKTQSALLESMQEKKVTVFGTTYPLPQPFFVIATQNPLEMEGTYPLPEAQLERFLFKINVEYPPFEELKEIVLRTTGSEEREIEAIMDGEELLEFNKLAREVPVAEKVLDFALKVLSSTHKTSPFATEKVKKYVSVGASPRGIQSIILAAKVMALLDGRYHVSFADIEKVAVPALRHRLILNFEGMSEGIKGDEIIKDILTRVEKG
ncbi:MoxR-like ATPase [Anaerobranca californiensis DSM 14826]|uniref:MoxR-like ATPase n=1 Tax=Anaerobranca californiensis DSM 14826 TaxID=1120989 RepID=A0A1M6LAD1_9FIRM|nr:MoxR family ATPase [Anaerobranca californiensis]SHJ68161.1 MoxR-like ATPase [Anaerobranca californiensis DSM 14826]